MRSWAAQNRPWVLALAAFVLCVAAAVLAPPPRPVYALDAQLVFTPSNAAGYGNAYRADASNMIYFAAAVERIYNQTPTTARVASSDATLYGVGIRDGSRVTLPNSGGQWQTSFNQPYLRIEVVSPNEAETRARFEQIETRIRSIAEQRQSAAGLDVADQVNLDLSPSEPVVQYVSGSHTKELVAGVLLGLLAAGGVYTVARRRESRRPAPRGTLVAA